MQIFFKELLEFFVKTLCFMLTTIIDLAKIVSCIVLFTVSITAALLVLMFCIEALTSTYNFLF